MSRQLPTVAQLQAIAAAARHLSFQKAAEELHITGPAISHRVRDYELLTGTTFFERGIREINLTSDGRQQLPTITHILKELSGLAGKSKGKQPKTRRLNVAAPSLLFSKLILPHLPEFYRLHPNSEVDIEVTQSNRELKKYDLVILYDRPASKTWHREKLMTATPIVVYSPRILKTIPKRDRAQFLLQHFPLIHFSYSPKFWSPWLKKFRVNLSNCSTGLTVSNMTEAVTAAISGLGIAVAVKELIKDELQRGSLIACPEFHLRPSAFYLSRRTKKTNSEQSQFQQWLKQMARL